MASTGGSNSTRQTRVSASALKAEKTVVKLPLSAAGAVENAVSSTQPQGGKSSRREVLIRQPSYCKILDDLKGAEAKVANMKQESSEGAIEVAASESEESGEGLSQQQVQTITINGQQYQIVSPIGVDGVQTIVAASGSGSGGSSAPVNSSVVQYAASTQNGQTVFIPGTVAAASASSPQIISVATASSPTSAGAGSSVEEQTRKREIRLLKNREAARECRNKKKEYIKCLENRVAILENQNKALIEELKSLKELYTGQKS